MSDGSDTGNLAKLGFFFILECVLRECLKVCTNEENGAAVAHALEQQHSLCPFSPESCSSLQEETVPLLTEVHTVVLSL